MLGFESLFRCQKEKTPICGVFSFFDIVIEDSYHSAKRRGVRISRPKVGMLAYQTQGEEIFALGEYPYSVP